MEHETDFQRLPGLFRLWDIQFIICGGDVYQVHYAEQTEDGVPLFEVYRKPGRIRGSTVGRA